MNPTDAHLTQPPHFTTVLVVDDSVSVRKALERILTPHGYHVRMADSAEQALTMLSPVPDLVLADILMPGLSGIDLARRLRDERPEVPVLLMSGVVDEITQQDARHVGAHQVLKKPFTPSELLPAIEPYKRVPEQLQPSEFEYGDEPVRVTQTSHLGGLDRLPGLLSAALYSSDGEEREYQIRPLEAVLGTYARFFVTAGITAASHVEAGKMQAVHLQFEEGVLSFVPHQHGYLYCLFNSLEASKQLLVWQASGVWLN
ncbi:response regulator [Deinococcus sp.]|uniref:response regulator n=1 Tax=Deinococcus sp. TaxID=47478 RepID=UPI0025FA81C6|nr:response regulator [Deinococcus sp.]